METDIDIIAPFAALSEKGKEISSIDSRSELAHRIMLTNLIRLLGEVKSQKEAHGYTTYAFFIFYFLFFFGSNCS